MPRVKPHFKVHLSIGNHRKTATLFQDNDLFAAWVRLGLLAVERRAALMDDIFLVGDKELQVLTGKGRRDVARKLLERLADISPISVERLGDVWQITFPKFAEKQGFRPKNVGPLNAHADAQPKRVPTEPLSDEPEPATTPTSGEKPPNDAGSPESDDLGQVRPDGRADDVRRTWSECVRAAAGYGKRWTRKPSPTRIRMMAARLRDFPSADPDALVRVIHGAVRSWDRDEQMIAKYLRPETVYQASKFEKYLEAYNEPEKPPAQRRRDNGRRKRTVTDDATELAEERGLIPRRGTETAKVVDITPRNHRR